MRVTVALAALLVLFSGPAWSQTKTPGYGPWNFGMTLAQVEAVSQHGPYSPVPATGGLETMNGDFEGQKAHVSFVFGPAGLRHIQVWAYTGGDAEQAAQQWHRAYRHLVSRYGEVRTSDGPLPSDLTVDQLKSRLPASFTTRNPGDFLAEVQKRGSGEIQMIRIKLEPLQKPQDADVFAELIQSREMGYWVFVFYRLPGGGPR
jgi:hypothetical protein